MSYVFSVDKVKIHPLALSLKSRFPVKAQNVLQHENMPI